MGFTGQSILFENIHPFVKLHKGEKEMTLSSLDPGETDIFA